MPDLNVKISFKALSLNGCSNSELLIWQGFRLNSGIQNLKNRECPNAYLKIEVFWSYLDRYKNKKAHKIYILQAFECV